MGLDPASAVEFAASYAAGCGPGPIVVGHDGRASAPVFLHAVLGGIAATGRDVLLAGPTTYRKRLHVAASQFVADDAAPSVAHVSAK